MRKLMVAIMALAAVLLGGVAFSPVASAQGEECQTILEIAAGNEDFSTLVAAVTAAGLDGEDGLGGDGPFTVFAPTNDAFAALPPGTVDSLLEDPSGALTDILLLHVIAGAAVDSAAAVEAAGTNVETLGGPVAVALDGEDLTVGGATVISADIEACNGIIHVIDSVILEPAQVDETTTTTTTTTAPPAAGGETATTMPMPTRVDTGDSGLAASTGVNGALVALLAGLAIVGLGSSSFALARARRQD